MRSVGHGCSVALCLSLALPLPPSFPLPVPLARCKTKTRGHSATTRHNNDDESRMRSVHWRGGTGSEPGEGERERNVEGGRGGQFGQGTHKTPLTQHTPHHTHSRALPENAMRTRRLFSFSFQRSLLASRSVSMSTRTSPSFTGPLTLPAGEGYVSKRNRGRRSKSGGEGKEENRTERKKESTSKR